ncbi:MAG: DUF5522 domain-containing protein [Blastocatellia bacterium]
MEELIEEKDFYWEGGLMVFTAKFHLRRGSCCGSGCRHCPYEPRWTKDASVVAAEPRNAKPANQTRSADSSA